jgi:hypothetical protein
VAMTEPTEQTRARIGTLQNGTKKRINICIESLSIDHQGKAKEFTLNETSFFFDFLSE